MQPEWPTPNTEEIPTETPAPGSHGDLPESGKGDDDPKEN